MTVEVKVEETPVSIDASEVVIPQEKPEKIGDNESVKGDSDEKLVDETKKGDSDEKCVDNEMKKSDSDDLKLNVVQKSSSYREESNFLSDLEEFEKKALTELKSKVEQAILGNNLFKKEETKKKEIEKNPEQQEVGENNPEGEKKPENETKEQGEINENVSIWGVPLLASKGGEGTDVILLKFLRAREFKVNQAFEMLKKTLQWRKESEIDSILDEEIDLDLSSAFYMNGVDREGHPVCYNVYGVFSDNELYSKAFGNEESRKKFLKWRFQLMEKGIQKLDLKPGGVTSLLQINDLKNSPAPSRKDIRVAMNQAVSLLQDNYPEFVAKNVFINVPFWYYALNALLSPFLTQRSKSKFVVTRPAKTTETLLKYIPAQEIPVQYGGFKRENDFEFSKEDDEVSELLVKANSTETIEISTPEVGATLIWDLTVVNWEVNYKEEFVPNDEGSYTVIIQKGKKMNSNEEPIRNTFTNNENGKIVLTIENNSSKKKRVLYRYKTKKTIASF